MDVGLQNGINCPSMAHSNNGAEPFGGAELETDERNRFNISDENYSRLTSCECTSKSQLLWPKVDVAVNS